jgi:Fe-S cluster biogenesis protein NfuA
MNDDGVWQQGPTGWPSGTVEERVRFALDEVRPALLADGGDVVFVAIEGSTVRVDLTGACRTCPMARSTLSEFVAERVRLYAPEIEHVVSGRVSPVSASTL